MKFAVYLVPLFFFSLNSLAGPINDDPEEVFRRHEMPVFAAPDAGERAIETWRRWIEHGDGVFHIKAIAESGGELGALAAQVLADLKRFGGLAPSPVVATPPFAVYRRLEGTGGLVLVSDREWGHYRNVARGDSDLAPYLQAQFAFRFLYGESIEALGEEIARVGREDDVDTVAVHDPFSAEVVRTMTLDEAGAELQRLQERQSLLAKQAFPTIRRAVTIHCQALMERAFAPPGQ